MAKSDAVSACADARFERVLKACADAVAEEFPGRQVALVIYGPADQSVAYGGTLSRPEMTLHAVARLIREKQLVPDTGGAASD